MRNLSPAFGRIDVARIDAILFEYSRTSASLLLDFVLVLHLSTQQRCPRCPRPGSRIRDWRNVLQAPGRQR
eukprot:2677894-Pleurochrysis_carterae.AAC.1